jgi:ribosomal protein S18 acetylase RimI-like enzyme
MSLPRVTPVVVRTATEPDLLHDDVGGRAGEYRPQLSAVLRSANGVVFVAEVDGDIVGRVTVDTTYGDADISGFVVAKRLRRHGIGSTLMDAAEAEAQAQRCSRIRLSVAKGNGGALALYDARGYERIGENFSAGLRSKGVVIHAPEPVWEMVKPVG